MASGGKSYLRAAFANVYNLALFGGAVAAAAATGEYVLAAAAVGVEAVWLLFGPDLKGFRRAVDKADREERDKADRERVSRLLESLPERDWQRAKALDELRREIERDMQNNPTFQVIMLGRVSSTSCRRCTPSFVHLANACSRAETYLSALDPRELERQLKAQEAILQKMTDPQVKSLAQKNLDVLQKRQVTIREIENFLARARGQMNLIENSVRLLRDQALTMTSPNQLGEQLDDLLTGVDALQQTAKDTEAIYSSRMDPIAEISSGDEAGVRPGSRVRS